MCLKKRDKKSEEERERERERERKSESEWERSQVSTFLPDFTIPSLPPDLGQPNRPIIWSIFSKFPFH